MKKALMVQGTSSGAGKTTLVTALCRIFANEGYRVAPFKSQNMSSYSYVGKDFEISRAQAIQAVAARTEIDPSMNPILLKPLGDYNSEVFVNGKFYKKMHAYEYYKKFALTKGLTAAKRALDYLLSRYDLVILEGAGSPAEINLQRYDIANMRMARHCLSPVILVTDIDKGGSFASVIGTMSLLEKGDKKLVKGFVINKFRGDLKILAPGLDVLSSKTGRPVLGTIPMVDLDIPDEDSLYGKAKRMTITRKRLISLDDEIERLGKVVKTSLNMKIMGDLIN